MKSVAKQSRQKAAFTIVELLTVMSVIIILISLLVPALNMVKRYAKRVMQKNQFHSIEVALETFHAEWEGYPESGAGAIALAVAMVGQDRLGYNPTGDYDYDGTEDLSGRRAYLTPDKANAYMIRELYDSRLERVVLCDMYANVTHRLTGRLVGMPILYYRANPSGNLHDPEVSPSPVLPPLYNFYDYRDNNALADLGVPFDTSLSHPLFDNPAVFYQKTLNPQIQVVGNRPYNANSYILLSAGFNGLYGTDDDVFNFGR